MGFSQDMTNMATGFRRSFDQRMEGVGRVFNNTHNTLRNARNTLKGFRTANNNLFEQTHQLCDETQRFLRKCHNTRTQMARTQKNHLKQECNKIGGEIRQGLRNFRQAMGAFRTHEDRTPSARGMKGPSRTTKTFGKKTPQKKRRK